MADRNFDVLVIGAGAAGMMAALEMALTGRSVAVLEAKNHTGGRMRTTNIPGFEKPVGLGAEFIHGNLPVTLQLLKDAGIKKDASGGEVWESKQGKLRKTDDFIPDYKKLLEELKSLPADMAVSEFLNIRFAEGGNRDMCIGVRHYVEGYYAADVTKTSSFTLLDELENGEDVNYKVHGGYGSLVNYLEDSCQTKGVEFFLQTEAKKIGWRKDVMRIESGSDRFIGKRLLITVSLGVLQADGMVFSPSIPDKIAVIKQLGFGHVLKINMQFREAFWKDKSFTQNKDVSKAGFLLSDQAIPTWWTQHPLKEKSLVGWLGGPPAKAYADKTKQEVVAAAIPSLAGLFGISESVVTGLLAATEWCNWTADPHFRGAYSYNVVNGEMLVREAAEPIEQTLYFAGEGFIYGNQAGTVEAALQSGRDTAHHLISEM